MKLRYQLCDFSLPMPNGKFMDPKSMQRILDSDEFKSRMKSHDLMGTISHKMRWDEEKNKESHGLPHSDLMMLDGTAANCVEKLWMEDDKLFCDMQVLNTPLGDRIESLINKDCIYPDVSMVVRQDEYGEKVMITDFLGVDFTFDPALKTEFLATFSKSSNPEVAPSKNEGSYTRFMLNRESVKNPTSILCTNSKCKVIDSDGIAPTQSELETYSLREFIRVRNRKPIQALQLIITDIKAYLSSVAVDDIRKNRKLILEYLTSYLFTKISEILTDKSTKMVNLVMILGLNRFCDMKTVMEFQRICNMILRERKTLGYISKRYQQMLAKATNDLVMSILGKILDNLTEEKKSAFLGDKNAEENRNAN